MHLRANPPPLPDNPSSWEITLFFDEQRMMIRTIKMISPPALTNLSNRLQRLIAENSEVNILSCMHRDGLITKATWS